MNSPLKFPPIADYNMLNTPLKSEILQNMQQNLV